MNSTGANQGGGASEELLKELFEREAKQATQPGVEQGEKLPSAKQPQRPLTEAERRLLQTVERIQAQREQRAKMEGSWRDDPRKTRQFKDW